ncbi:PRC-barrel domain-containing protein [Litorisediminicola beolgyonensis]|uniref:PRC-barrel domain-containing protein n=1 Tax=Litorisediminicola beolgyonensis TaxID=1173614 RepID=A0ABW3ZI66_9RHOB
MLRTLLLSAAALTIAVPAWAQSDASTDTQLVSAVPPGTPELSPDLRMSRVKDLVGLPVVNPEGETLGEIEAIQTAGESFEAILSHGGLLGLGDSDVVIPITDLTLSEDRASFILAMTEDELAALPEIDDDAIDPLIGEVTLGDLLPTQNMGRNSHMNIDTTGNGGGGGERASSEDGGESAQGRADAPAAGLSDSASSLSGGTEAPEQESASSDGASDQGEDDQSASEESSDGQSATEESADGEATTEESADGQTTTDENADGLTATEENADGQTATEEAPAEEGAQSEDGSDPSAEELSESVPDTPQEEEPGNQTSSGESVPETKDN